MVSSEPLTQVPSAFLPSSAPDGRTLALAGSAVGSCLVSEDNSWNLGVVQISPQAAANGSLSIVYVNGDRCGNQRFSTRITFECAQTSVRELANEACLSVVPFPFPFSLWTFSLISRLPVFSWVLGLQYHLTRTYYFPPGRLMFIKARKFFSWRSKVGYRLWLSLA